MAPRAEELLTPAQRDKVLEMADAGYVYEVIGQRFDLPVLAIRDLVRHGRKHRQAEAKRDAAERQKLAERFASFQG